MFASSAVTLFKALNAMRSFIFLSMCSCTILLIRHIVLYCTKRYTTALDFSTFQELIYQEFFSQGDLEKAQGQKPMAMMDRDNACIPELQIDFLDKIALPVFRCETIYVTESANARGMPVFVCA